MWAEYRMWRLPIYAVAASGSSAEFAGNWKPTEITFRARSQSEAQRKAEKFWRDAELGAGSMLCLPVGQVVQGKEQG